MFRFVLPLLLLASTAPAHACGLEGKCQRLQSGDHYVVSNRPVERYITDCEQGVDCHHMQSGQHYSVQTPRN
jgi:uncharacterized protein (UPF0179 family)